MAQNYPICVTAFLSPKSLLGLYQESQQPEDTKNIICVGLYMSDHTITRICNFDNPTKAMNYAFILKGQNCPISKNAFAFLMAEIKQVKARIVAIEKPEDEKMTMAELFEKAEADEKIMDEAIKKAEAKAADKAEAEAEAEALTEIAADWKARAEAEAKEKAEPKPKKRRKKTAAAA